MSLSLDELLDDTEQQRFQGYVEQYPVLARQWRSWQLLDRQLTLTPAAEPVSGFVERFELRLVQQDRRRLLGRNLFIAALIILIWAGCWLAVRRWQPMCCSIKETGWLNWSTPWLIMAQPVRGGLKLFGMPSLH